MAYPIFSTSLHPNAELVIAAQNGDRTALHRLYIAYGEMVRNTAARLTMDPDLIDDICQNAWTCALTKLRELGRPMHFPAWLHRIAVNAALMAFRSDSRRARSEAAYATNQLNAVSQNENYTLLSHAVTRLLPPGEWTIMMLHAEGLTHREIGATLGISAGTSKSQLHKARQRLGRKRVML